jgi:hypothetical protein
MSPIEAAVVFALALFAAFTQSLSGFGFSLLLVPPLALAVGPRNAVVAANVLSALVNVPALILWRSQVQWRLFAKLLAGSVVGMPVGLVVLLGVEARTLKLAIAFVVLFSTAVIWRGLRIRRQMTAFDAAAGFVSGVLNTSTSMSGPPVVLYLQGRGLAPDPFRATLAAFFLCGSLIAVGLFAAGGAIDVESSSLAAAGLPGLLAGWWLGTVAYARIGPGHFRHVVLIILLLSGIVAGATAVVA